MSFTTSLRSSETILEKDSLINFPITFKIVDCNGLPVTNANLHLQGVSLSFIYNKSNSSGNITITKDQLGMISEGEKLLVVTTYLENGMYVEENVPYIFRQEEQGPHTVQMKSALSAPANEKALPHVDLTFRDTNGRPMSDLWIEVEKYIKEGTVPVGTTEFENIGYTDKNGQFAWWGILKGQFYCKVYSSAETGPDTFLGKFYFDVSDPEQTYSFMFAVENLQIK